MGWRFPNSFLHENCKEKRNLRLRLTFISNLQRQAYNPLSGIIQFDEDGRRNNFTLYVGEVSRGKIVKTAQWYPYYGDWLNITRNATEQQEQMYRRFQQNLLIVASRCVPL